MLASREERRWRGPIKAPAPRDWENPGLRACRVPTASVGTWKATVVPGIYLRHGQTYIAMRETPYDAEDVLQQLIERQPEMLAGDDAPHGSLILVRREAGVSDREDAGARWSLDHLYLDAKGVPTLVEVKRSSDTRARREVVAQMLDYAANARTSFSAERMTEWLEESARQRGTTAADCLLDAFGVDDVEAFWQLVDTNLKAERFRLVFVSDSIGAELRRIIEFLNSQMSRTEVLAIEVKQYTDADGDHQTIVPRVVGDTEEARAVKRSSPRAERLDREMLVTSIREQSELAAAGADGVLDWAEREPRLDVRYTRTGGIIETAGRPLLSLKTSRAIDRILHVQLDTLAAHGEPWDETQIEQLVSELAGIGLNLEPRERRWPRAPLEPLADETRRRQVLTVMERVLDTLTGFS